jgi:hypothetical protein
MLHRFIYDVSSLQDRLLHAPLGDTQTFIIATASKRKADQDESTEDQSKL